MAEGRGGVVKRIQYPFLFRDIAPPGLEGWPRHQEKYREASFDGADGVVVQDQTEMFLNLNHHPVCAASDASHFLLTGAATPPVQEGRWPGPSNRIADAARVVEGIFQGLYIDRLGIT